MGNDITARTAIFKGLNRMPYIEDGELRSMKNLSSDAYPFLSTRKGREEYKISVYVPGVPGDGYLADVDKLPDATKDYEGKIVRLIESIPKYIPGEFYYSENGNWIKGINNKDFIGRVDDVSEFKTTPFEKSFYVYDDPKYKEKYENKIIKFVGKNREGLENGKTYRYKLQVEAYWERVRYAEGKNEGTFTNDKAPTATEELANKKTFFNNADDDYALYQCFIRGAGYWRECDGEWDAIDAYEPVKEMPKQSNRYLVRYLGNYENGNITEAYYTCAKETFKNEPLYYYVKNEKFAGEYLKEELPEATADNLGKTYFTGAALDAYYICEWNGTEYKWNETQRPQVEKYLTIAEYINTYTESELDSIIEIGKFLGKIAVLYKTKDGKFNLFYEKEIFEIIGVSDIAGKKLQTLGNKIVVGEGGSYLYRDKKTNKIILHPGAVEFKKTIKAGYVEFGNGRWTKDSYIQSNSLGEIRFVCYKPEGKGEGYKEVYEGLKTPGTDFKVEFDGNVYYLQSAEGCSYKPNKLIGGFSVGDWWFDDYADELVIEATGFNNDYYWEAEKGKKLTFESTTSFLPDVEIWKKRLWGYAENYIQSTVQDIFDDSGNLDWTTGDNTYTEAISQPIWQGGEVTGLAALRDALIIFKTDNITIFTGNYPAIMQGSTISCRGLLPENRESVAVANETVYYLAEDGVYRFSGGIPQLISGQAKIKGTDAVGASDGRKYWLSVREEDGSYSLYVFDINLGTWHKEDDTEAVSFTMLGSKMYMATATQIFCLDAIQEDVEWEAELWYDEGTFNHKKYKGFEVRGDIGECEIYLKADDGEWQLYTFTEGKLSIKSEPFWCRELGIKLKGRGICELKSLDRTYEIVQ